MSAKCGQKLEWSSSEGGGEVESGLNLSARDLYHVLYSSIPKAFVITSFRGRNAGTGEKRGTYPLLFLRIFLSEISGTKPSGRFRDCGALV